MARPSVRPTDLGLRAVETDEARAWLEYAAASPLRLVASMARSELGTAQPGCGTE
ncbi:hypothetical protein EDD90_10833 [Streptomyces sp. Ag109_O5-1]|uniref:hypothetical protein n=1 Tax=Streptomyces sasae TaxID=1266772 RepID=UPI000FA6E3BC|nr:hypothetical protein [Streptomyces sasae]RPE27143.1 hypothetical protein EDD90_10833 [Streptomyces sp. Ag109_O5-1]